MSTLTALLLGKDTPHACAALEHLIERGIDVRGVVGPGSEPGELVRHATVRGVAARSHEEISSAAPRSVDLVLSYLYPRLIRPATIAAARVACLNFHPAPLPELRGLGGFNVAILDGHTEFGVSAHHVAPTIDEGELVEVRRFPIDPANETAWTLAEKTRPRLLALFRDVVDRLVAGETLPRVPQGRGRYIDRAEFERLRRVRPGDSPEVVSRKARAFWYPPFEGAVIEHGGHDFTLVTPEILRAIADERDARSQPDV